MSRAGTSRQSEMRQILFIQGGGAGAHDEWDDKLVASLERELGDAYEVRYPRMPDEGSPTCDAWGSAIQAQVADLTEGAVLVGHPVGATLLVQALADQPPLSRVAGIVLVGAPFVGDGGWPSEQLELRRDLGARLPPSAQVHVFHGLDDTTAPPSHADLYARVIEQAQVHLLTGRDHQLDDDLSEVARVIERLTRADDSSVTREPPGGARPPQQRGGPAENVVLERLET